MGRLTSKVNRFAAFLHVLWRFKIIARRTEINIQPFCLFGFASLIELFCVSEGCDFRVEDGFAFAEEVLFLYHVLFRGGVDLLVQFFFWILLFSDSEIELPILKPVNYVVELHKGQAEFVKPVHKCLVLPLLNLNCNRFLNEDRQLIVSQSVLRLLKRVYELLFLKGRTFKLLLQVLSDLFKPQLIPLVVLFIFILRSDI